jgi:hypothetical protein
MTKMRNLTSIAKENNMTGNQQRADRCRKMILKAYPGDALENGIIDALTDIRHACDMAELDYAELDRMAYHHYIAELDLTRSM